MDVIVFLQGALRGNSKGFLAGLGEISSCVTVCDADSQLLDAIGTTGTDGRGLLVTDCLDPLILLESCCRSSQISLLVVVDSIAALDVFPVELYDRMISFVVLPKGEPLSRHLIGLVGKAIQETDCTLGGYFGQSPKLCRVTINSGQRKTEVLDELSAYILKEAEKPGHAHLRIVCDRMVEVLDELLMNAVFHANPRFLSERPHLDFTLEAREDVEACWIIDENLFGISVVDKFGRLDRASVLKHLTGKEEKLPIEQRRTAGLGFRLVFKRAEQVIVSVTPGVRTEVICLFGMGDGKNRLPKVRTKGYLHLRGSSAKVERRGRVTQT